MPYVQCMICDLQCNIASCDPCEFPITLPLQSPTSTQMSAVTTVQRDCESVYSSLFSHSSLIYYHLITTARTLEPSSQELQCSHNSIMSGYNHGVCTVRFPGWSRQLYVSCGMTCLYPESSFLNTSLFYEFCTKRAMIKTLDAYLACFWYHMRCH